MSMRIVVAIPGFHEASALIHHPVMMGRGGNDLQSNVLLWQPLPRLIQCWHRVHLLGLVHCTKGACMHPIHATSLVSGTPPPHWACVGSYLCQLAPTACSPCLASAWSREATPRALPCCHSHEEAARLLRQKGQPPHHPPLDRACDGRGLQGVQLPQGGGGCMGVSVSVSVVPAALSWWL